MGCEVAVIYETVDKLSSRLAPKQTHLSSTSDSFQTKPPDRDILSTTSRI